MYDMKIDLTRFPLRFVTGIYKINGEEGRMPDRMRMLATGSCADNFAKNLADKIVVSDMFRSAESSLDAMQRKRGVQPPSFSHHNYGRAIDLDTTASMKRLGVKTKRELDKFMESCGWYCYRGDHRNEFEAWHFDYLGDLDPSQRPRYPYKNERSIAWAACSYLYAHNWQDVLNDLAGGERSGLRYFAAAMKCQDMLKDRGFYNGAIDGKIGPISRAAIGALQRAWLLPTTGRLDARTVQILTYVCADVTITPMVEVPAEVLGTGPYRGSIFINH